MPDLKETLKAVERDLRNLSSEAKSRGVSNNRVVQFCDNVIKDVTEALTEEKTVWLIVGPEGRVRLFSVPMANAAVFTVKVKDGKVISLTPKGLSA